MFARMKIYTVYTHPDKDIDQKPVFVREGFSFGAFVFGALWALYHRLWLVFLLIVAVDVALGYVSQMHLLLKPTVVAIQFGFSLMVGYMGNDWIRARLLRSEFELVDITVSDSLLRAEQRYFERALVTSSCA